jgi:hypothetical protein
VRMKKRFSFGSKMAREGRQGRTGVLDADESLSRLEFVGLDDLVVLFNLERSVLLVEDDG